MNAGVSPKPQVYHCGNLVYTKAGLVALFAWLLWGDFCYTLMEAVVPSILPLKLKELGSPNWLMGVIMATLPGILNMTICPWVSFKSDRYRSKWGRRIPFILWTLPFLCICLVMLGICDDISAMLQKCMPALREHAPATITLGFIAVFMAMFQFFNMFVASVFSYLFNDVVPPQFLGRFIGTFKIVGTGAGAVYNFFIFKYAESHMSIIFTGAALLYFIGIGMMCFMVKEREYPPVEGESDKDNKGWGGLKTFLKESYTHSFYWTKFLSTAFAGLAGSVGVFSIFFNREMGLDLDHVGKISAVSSVAIMAATYFMAIFIDRWHPLRICVYGAVFGVIGSALQIVWIFVTLPGEYYFWLNMGNTVISSFLSALVAVATLPALMRIFPQSRFGQFCSADALVRSAFTTIGGLLAGGFIDLVKMMCKKNPDFSYRFMHIWITFFIAVAAVFKVINYIQWNKRGGDKHFHPPASWNPDGIEEMPLVPTIGPQSKWMGIGTVIIDAVIGISAMSIPVLMWWMYVHNEMFAFKWYGLIVLPFSLIVLGLWIILRKDIWRDIKAAQTGAVLHNGIPHHGMIIIVGVKFLLALGICVCQIGSALYLNIESGAVAFGIANNVINLMIIGGIYLMRRIERGFSITIDEKPAAAEAIS